MHKSAVLLTIISYDSLRVVNVLKEAANANKKQVKHTHSINMYVYVCEQVCKQQTELYMYSNLILHQIFCKPLL